MVKIIALSNQKGGKSVTTASLGIGLAQKGKKVLLIDNDPQSLLTISLSYPKIGTKKIPSINTHKQEYAVLLTKGYRQTKKTMKNLLTAKENTDRLLSYSPSAPVQENCGQ